MGDELRSRAGMTVLEVLVVCAILAVAAGTSALVVPRIDGVIRLETALHQLAADLRLARTLAIASARQVRLVLVEGGTSYARQSAREAGYETDRTRRLPRGITIATVGSGGTLVFSAFGDGENGTIVLENRHGVRRALVVNQRGRVTVTGAPR